jgi:hypothetical protein
MTVRNYDLSKRLRDYAHNFIQVAWVNPQLKDRLKRGSVGDTDYEFGVYLDRRHIGDIVLKTNTEMLWFIPRSDDAPVVLGRLP